MKSLRLFQKYFLNQQPASGPVKQDDFDMHPEPIDFIKYKNDLLGYGAKVIEKISYQAKTYEVLQLDINPKASKCLLIFAGVHGNEFAAALAVLDLLEDIKRDPGHYSAWHTRIVTPFNPVGFAHQSRYNETGHDINRDFKNFDTPGGRLQKRLIGEFKPDFLISLHEGPQDGFFVVAESDVPQALKRALVGALKAERIALAKKSFLQLGISEGYWRKPQLFYALQRLLGIYTLGRYTHERHIPQLTTESPWASKDVKARKRPHVITVRTVVGG